MTYFVYYCGSSKIHKDSWKNGLEQQEISGLTFFDMNTIRAATNNFNVSNKLGQGGFGPVYKVIRKIVLCILFSYLCSVDDRLQHLLLGNYGRQEGNSR